MKQSAETKPKIKLPIILMVWPTAAIVLAVIAYAVIMALASASLESTDPQPVLVTIINVVLFLVGLVATLLGLPSFIIGLVLLITRISASGEKARQPIAKSSAAAASDHQPTSHNNGLAVASLVTGIAGLVTSWIGIGVILGVLAVVFSAVSFKKSSKKGFVITGLVTGICSIVIGLFFIIALIATAAYESISDQAETLAAQSIASTLSADAQSFAATYNQYPSYQQVMEYSLLSNDEKQEIGGYNSTADVIYVGCYGDGAIIWYWDGELEEYVNSYSLGQTTDCNY